MNMGGADARIELIRDWLASELGWPRDCRLEPASADASFRRYFRVWRPRGGTRIIMDAPPGKEDTAPYLHASRLLRSCGVHVPEVEAADGARGLLLLEDLGATHMLARLNAGAAAALLYDQALDTRARCSAKCSCFPTGSAPGTWPWRSMRKSARCSPTPSGSWSARRCGNRSCSYIGT